MTVRVISGTFARAETDRDDDAVDGVPSTATSVLDGTCAPPAYALLDVRHSARP